uniref:Ig-like domain-containing protein n=1 Tax=Knipowitschia caucasica TaxID=637954 RepID=A0AAV2L8K1_KNICA
MGAVNKDHWYFMVLLCLCFVKVQAHREPSTLALSEGMELDCLCPWSGNLSMVSWTKGQDKHPIAVFHPDYGTSFAYQYRERVEFLRRSSLDGSIALRNVTHQDTGLYHCSVQTFPQGPWSKSIYVEDLDEPPAEDEEDEAASGLEFPTSEALDTSLQLLAELNENLTLSCTGLPNVTVYQVIMEKRVGGRPWDIIAVCKQLDGGLLTEDYSDRGSISCAHTLDVSLHLLHVQPEDSGFYRCTFHTETGSHHTNMSLTVSERGGFSLSMYMFYVYCSAGTAGLLLLIAIILIIVRQRNKNKRIEYSVKNMYPAHKRSWRQWQRK